MDHSEIKDRLFNYYDGELPSAERTLIKLHVLDCAECRSELELWAQTATTLLKPLSAGSTEYFVQNVMRRVRNFVQQDEGQRWQTFVRWAFPTLALSATAFAALFIYTIWPTEAPASSELLLEGSGPAITTSWNTTDTAGDPLTLADLKEER